MGQPKNLYERLAADIRAGAFGASGSRFLTVRELGARCGVSYVTAQRAAEQLRRAGLVRLMGNHAYITTGRMRADAPLSRELTLARGGCRRFGLHIRRIDNLFFTSLAAQLIAFLEQMGWQTVVMSSGGEPESERRILDEFLELGVSGIFTCPGKVNVYENCVLPVVSIGRSALGGNAVQVNNKSAGVQVAAHLMEEGYRRFIYVGTAQLPLEQDYRLIGFRKGLDAGGFTLHPEDIFTLSNADPTKDDLHHLVRQRIRMSCEPVGIFCYHDILAIGILELCRRSGIEVPGMAGVAGFDDLQFSTYMGNQLTTISYRYDWMAKKAAELMFTLLSEPEPVLHEDIYVNQVLTVRGSTSLGATKRG